MYGLALDLRQAQVAQKAIDIATEALTVYASAKAGRESPAPRQEGV